MALTSKAKHHKTGSFADGQLKSVKVHNHFSQKVIRRIIGICSYSVIHYKHHIGRTLALALENHLTSYCFLKTEVPSFCLAKYAEIHFQEETGKAQPLFSFSYSSI